MFVHTARMDALSSPPAAVGVRFALHPALQRFTIAVMAGEEHIRSVYAGDISAIRAERSRGWARLAAVALHRADDLIHPIIAVEVALGWRTEEPVHTELERLGWFIGTAESFRKPLTRAVGRRLLFLVGAPKGAEMAAARRSVLVGASAGLQAPVDLVATAAAPRGAGEDVADAGRVRHLLLSARKANKPVRTTPNGRMGGSITKM